MIIVFSDLNAAALDSPETSTSTLSNNGSPQPVAEACSVSFMEQPMDQLNQPVQAACGSNFSNSDSDPGYESANSPYSGHFSPQLVSPGQANFGNGFANGQRCQLPAFSPSPNLATNQFESENNEVDQADQVLDTLLKNFSSEDAMNGELNMAAIFSTIQSLTSQNEPPVSTFVHSPGQNNKFSPSRQGPLMASQKRTEQKSSSVLRNILTMPEKDLPKDLPTFGIQFNNNSKSCSKQGSHSVNQGPCGQGKISAQKLESPPCDVPSTVNGWAGVCSGIDKDTCLHIDNSDDLLSLSGIPDEISDFAIQYLDTVLDAQADSVISQLQNGDDSFMDTSDSDVLTKVLINSLESHCSPSLTQTLEDDNYRDGSGVLEGNIPISQCHSPMSTDSQYSCMTPNGDASFFPNGSPTNTGSAGSSSHDHVYHQSVNSANLQNRSRSQTIPDNGLAGLYRQQNRNCRNSSCQTQTSEYCLSELERHLRNKRAEMSGESSLSTSPKPFLEQLLTGELTKDMYMKMERDRYDENHGPI